MKLQALLRKVHRWGAIAVMLPLGLVISAGLLLMLKKEIAWIQPPTLDGSAPGAVPAQSVAAMYEAAASAPELALDDWADLARVEARPKEGTFKFVAENGWEAQVDAATGEVIQVAYRRSDLIESLHDGSFFAGWTKLFWFFPNGIILLFLWGTGIYLFILPHAKRAEKRRKAAGPRPPS